MNTNIALGLYSIIKPTTTDSLKQDKKMLESSPKTPCDCKTSLGSKIVNRHLLSAKQYLKFLAQPKKFISSSNILNPRKKSISFKLSPRMNLLSRPHKRKIFCNWQDFHQILPIYKLEKFVDYLSNYTGKMNMADIIPSKKSKELQKSNRCKRVVKKRKICEEDELIELQTVVNILTNYLTDNQPPILNEYQKHILSKILTVLIQRKLWYFECRKCHLNATELKFIQAVKICSIFVYIVLMKVDVIAFQNQSAYGSSVELRASDISKRFKKDTGSDEKMSGAGDKLEKTQKNIENVQHKNLLKLVDETNAETIEYLSKLNQQSELDVANSIKPHFKSSNIPSAEDQAIKSITISKFTQTVMKTQGIINSEKNFKLLLAIRKYYNKRKDLHYKHIFDDLSLPKITLEEVMKCVENVLSNAMSEGQTSQLQYALQNKIIQWVNEVMTDDWDDCMDADVKLLSYELARFINDLDNVKGTTTAEKYIKEIQSKTSTKVDDSNLVCRLTSSTSIRGVDLNVQHVFNITPHSPGAVCCASLKVWSTWIKDVAENAKLWCIWINQVIENMHYLSTIIRGEMHDDDGAQLSLVRCDWKSFIINLDNDIKAWQQYSSHIQKLTEDVTTHFHGKCIECCPLCLEQDFNISEIGAEHLCKQLFDAMQYTEDWRKWLQEIVNETKTFTENKCLCRVPEIVELSTNNTIYSISSYHQALTSADPSIYSIELIN